jgi:hypothetical protein
MLDISTSVKNWFILPDTKIELEVRTMDQNSPRYLPNVAMSLLLQLVSPVGFQTETVGN